MLFIFSATALEDEDLSARARAGATHPDRRQDENFPAGADDAKKLDSAEFARRLPDER